jgi:hypothetical protein
MMTGSISFALVVNVPTIILVLLTFIGGTPAEYGRRALIVYAALLVAVFGALFGAALANPVVIYVAILAGFAAATLPGAWGLLIAAIALGAIAIAGLVVPLPFSLLGPVIACAGTASAFAHSRVVTDRLRQVP